MSDNVSDMNDQEEEKSSSRLSPKAQALSARLMAVQAFYQMKQSGKALRDVYDEFIEHRVDEDLDGHTLVKPNAVLFRRILFGVESRHIELDAVLEANLNKDASDRVVEPLLYSVLICGAYELMAHSEIDAPIIINDYLNVGHSFFNKNEVALINGVLDSINSVFR